MPNARHLAPLLGLLLATACNDDPLLKGTCVIEHHEALPENVPTYQHAIAADSEQRVHVAGSSHHLVRDASGGWSTEEDAFGETYFSDAQLAASGSGVAVALVSDGLRVARGVSAPWTTLFERSSQQCSGHPYLDRMEAAADGSVIIDSSEGLLRVREGAEPEKLDRDGAWTVDGAGLLTAQTGDALTIKDRFGETALPHSFMYVRHLAATPGGRAALLLDREKEGGVWAARRNERGAWDEGPTKLLAWTDAECPEDPVADMVCSSKSTRIEAAFVVASGESLIGFIVLRHGRGDLTWRCVPSVGGTGSCYWTWDGERTYERELHMGYLTAEAPALYPVAMPESWKLDEANPVAAPGSDGLVHALFENNYARIRCY